MLEINVAIVAVVCLLHAVASQILIIGGSPPSNNDDLYDPFDNDMDLDISLNPNTNNDFRSFSDFFGRNSLFLRMQFDDTNDRDINQNVRESIFSLSSSNKVSGNTWRYSAKVFENGQQTMSFMKSGSTPKLFLCKDQLCDDENGLEMASVFDNFGCNKNTKKYLHVMPTSTKVPAQMDEDTQAKDGWTLRFFRRYGYDDYDDVSDDNVDDIDSNVSAEKLLKHNQHCIVLMGLVCISMLNIILCCMMCRVRRRPSGAQQQSQLEGQQYVAMQETDAF